MTRNEAVLAGHALRRLESTAKKIRRDPNLTPEQRTKLVDEVKRRAAALQKKLDAYWGE